MRTLLLLDANSLIHRSFHALPPFTNKEGFPTGALYGLASVLIKITREDKPDFMAACFDRPEPTFREKIFKEYKIHRPPTPDTLINQIVEAKNLFSAFNIKTFEAPGFEADDLIGAVVQKFKNEADLKIVILTGDLDTLQLIDNNQITVRVFKKGITETTIYDGAAVKERYGIPPQSLPDYKGLVGDSSDNIPGVSGIGPKTAASILDKYGHLENFLDKGQQEKSYGKVCSVKEQVFLSRELGTVKRDAPLEVNNLNELACKGLSKKTLLPYFEKLGFQSLVKRLSNEKENKAVREGQARNKSINPKRGAVGPNTLF